MNLERLPAGCGCGWLWEKSALQCHGRAYPRGFKLVIMLQPP